VLVQKLVSLRLEFHFVTFCNKPILDYFNFDEIIFGNM
jgi:hypothetical protein